MRRLEDSSLGARHVVTYWIPFWDEPIVTHCTCGLAEDHMEITPIPGAEAVAAFVQRICAWLKKELRQ